MHESLIFEWFDQYITLCFLLGLALWDLNTSPGGRARLPSVNCRGFEGDGVLGVGAAMGVSFLIANFVMEKTWALRFEGGFET